MAACSACGGLLSVTNPDGWRGHPAFNCLACGRLEIGEIINDEFVDAEELETAGAIFDCVTSENQE